MDKYKRAYETNEDFKRFVDRHATDHKITVDEALKHLLVQLTYDILYSGKDE